MDSYHDLPFKIGELAESKSFMKGYRGAWFRCQIKDIAVRQGHVSYAMEYFDFPDEKVGWMKLYEKPHIAKGSLQQKKLQLMVRPCFPKSYLENEAPNLDNVSAVVVVYRDTWKVGDRVDWWCESCYWSAQITDLLGSDKVQIALLEPPLGEGGSYEALCKELRPSLEWSLEDGWTVPKALEKNETTAPCARFIIPFKKESKDASHDALGNQGTDKLEEDENKKQSCTTNMTVSLSPSAKMQPLHQMPQDNLLKVDPLEQAIYTKENVEEKLLGKEGAHARCKDGGIGHDVAIPTAGQKMEIVDHNKLILPKKRVRNGNSEIAHDHKAGKSSVVIGYPTLHEEGREANVPKKSSCKKDNSDFKGTDKLEEDENKKQSCTMNMTVSLSPSAKMQPLHQMPQDNLLKVDPLEQAIYTKENVEEKLLGKEGAHVRCKDGGIGHDVAIPTAGQKMEIVDHNKLILPKKRVRNGNSEIAHDHKAGKASVVIGYPTLHEEGREANVPKKGSCKKDNSDFKGFSNRSTIWRKEELNLTIYPDTVESSILAIEELINKIKWVNGVLQFGIDSASSKKASWQFLDNNNLSLE